jgi:hypothetical protein
MHSLKEIVANMNFPKKLDLSGLRYDPQNFRALYESEAGQELWKILTRQDNIIRMETATFLEQAAVEPLGPELLNHPGLGTWVNDDRVKQMIGHMARQVMEHLGYEIDRPGLRIMRAGLFTTAARYRLRAEGRNRTMKITTAQRLAWQLNTAKCPFNRWLDNQVKRHDGTLDIEKLYEVARRHGVTKRYDHLNPGQQRMNIGVKLRKCVPQNLYEA